MYIFIYVYIYKASVVFWGGGLGDQNLKLRVLGEMGLCVAILSPITQMSLSACL